MKAAAIVTLVALTLAGCEAFEPVDPSEYSPVLAVQSVFESGVPWSVLVERTVALGDDTDFGAAAVTDAVVRVSDSQGRTVLLPHVGFGRYGAPLRDLPGGRPVSLDDTLYQDGPAPRAGETYALRIEAPGYPPVTATSRTPAPATQLTVTPVDSGSPESRFARISVRFEDPPGRDRFEVVFATDNDVHDEVIRSALFATNAPVLTEGTFFDDVQGGAGTARYFTAFLDDADGLLPFEMWTDRAGSRVVGTYVATASEEYYRLRQAQARARSVEGNPFADPVRPYSNVEGGTGFFVGLTREGALIPRE